MPTIKYPKNPNIDTAFVEQEDGTKNRALMTAPQDISTLELPNNPNSTKGYVTVDGKKQRVILTADITGSGGGGSGLPDQTGHSGEFLTTDGTDASWSDKPLINKTTAPQGLAVCVGPYSLTGIYQPLVFTSGNIDSGNVNPASAQIILGNLTTAGVTGPKLSGWGATAVGIDVAATQTRAIAIGPFTRATAAGAIQLGSSGSGTTNSDANTFKVGNANGNFEMMSADGTIPTARLTKVNTTVTLAAADWSAGTQTVSVTGMTATGVVLVSPDPTDQSAYTSAGIICSAQAAGTLTFTCSTTPTADLSVNVVML